MSTIEARATPPAVEARWRGLKVYRNAERQPDLLLEVVRPLTRRLAGHAEDVHFVREWSGGPHVGIRFRTTAEDLRDTVAPMIGSSVTRYLASHPDDRPDRHDEAFYRTLARYERRHPVWPPAAADTVEWQSESDIAPTSPAAALIVHYHVATTEVLWSMLESVRAGRSPFAVAFDLMAAVGETYCANPRNPGIGSGFLSFRSHAELFLASCRHPDEVRAALRRQYASQRDTLRRRLVTVLDAVGGGCTVVPFVRDLRDATTPVDRQAEALLAAGVPLLPVGDPDGPDPHPLSRGLARSPMHRTILADRRFMRILTAEPWFQRYRVHLNLLYLQLTRLGISPVERYQLCHLVADTVEDVYGVTARQYMRDVAAHADPRPAS